MDGGSIPADENTQARLIDRGWVRTAGGHLRPAGPKEHAKALIAWAKEVGFRTFLLIALGGIAGFTVLVGLVGQVTDQGPGAWGGGTMSGGGGARDAVSAGCQCPRDTFGQNCSVSPWETHEYLPSAKEALEACRRDDPNMLASGAIQRQLHSMQFPYDCKHGFTGVQYQLYSISPRLPLQAQLGLVVNALHFSFNAGVAMNFVPRWISGTELPGDKTGREPKLVDEYCMFSCPSAEGGLCSRPGLACYFEAASGCGDMTIEAERLEREIELNASGTFNGRQDPKTGKPVKALQAAEVPLQFRGTDIPSPYHMRGMYFYKTNLLWYLWQFNDKTRHTITNTLASLDIISRKAQGGGVMSAVRSAADWVRPPSATTPKIGMYIPTCTPKMRAQRPSPCRPLYEYMGAANVMRKAYGAGEIVLVTDDLEAVLQTGDYAGNRQNSPLGAAEAYFKFIYGGIKPPREVAGTWQGGAAFVDVEEDLLYDKPENPVLREVTRLAMLSRCDYFVGVFDGPFPRTAYQLMMMEHGYAPPYISLDGAPGDPEDAPPEVVKKAVDKRRVSYLKPSSAEVAAHRRPVEDRVG